MCCGTGTYHSGWHQGHHVGPCACGVPFRHGPYFSTREEKIAWLEEYLEGLQEEATAINERIAALKGEA